MSFLDGRRYFVHGLGISGQAAAKLLAEDGREVVAFDENPTVVADYARLLGSESYGRRVSVVSPEDAEQALALCDRMVLSPGVPLNNPLVSAARVLAIPVDSEIEAAFHYTNADIVAVTGTNGKSTTVGIVGAILQSAGVSAVVAGNVGTPFTSVVRGGDIGVFVLELSSFQLDTISEFRANVAVLLNITPDHLDRYHHSFDEYASSKARILNRSDEATGFVYNADDVACVRISERFDGIEFPFSSTRKLDVESGVYVKDGSICRWRHGSEEHVIEVGEFVPVGVHNLENAMASVGVATALNIELSDISDGLRSYTPLPHRMEPVRTVGEITWINDSKATNVDATIKSLISIEGGVVLIVGGRDKEGDFGALVPHLERVRRAILIGEAQRVIRAALEGSCELDDAQDMSSAVEAAASYARPGDTVLLAPACASFDMFDDYKHRGEVFRSCVNAL